MIVYNLVCRIYFPSLKIGYLNASWRPISARDIKNLQHYLYNKRLRGIEAGEREGEPFDPKSDFGELKSTAILQKKFKF